MTSPCNSNYYAFNARMDKVSAFCYFKWNDDKSYFGPGPDRAYSLDLKLTLLEAENFIEFLKNTFKESEYTIKLEEDLDDKDYDFMGSISMGSKEDLHLCRLALCHT